MCRGKWVKVCIPVKVGRNKGLAVARNMNHMIPFGSCSRKPADRRAAAAVWHHTVHVWGRVCTFEGWCMHAHAQIVTWLLQRTPPMQAQDLYLGPLQAPLQAQAQELAHQCQWWYRQMWWCQYHLASATDLNTRWASMVGKQGAGCQQQQEGLRTCGRHGRHAASTDIMTLPHARLFVPVPQSGHVCSCMDQLSTALLHHGTCS